MELEKISELLKTQDNRITADPVFVVEREITDYGYDSTYVDDYHWVNPEDDHVLADQEEANSLDQLDDDGESTAPWFKCYYKKRWEFVTSCFTEKGCEDYIRINGHNLGKTRIYAHSGYRNFEWQAVRNHLIQLGVVAK